MNLFLKYFFRGLLIFVPSAATVALVWLVIKKVDGWLGLPVPGAGFLTLVALITVLGILASNFVTRKLFELVETVFGRLPLVKLLYASLKDLVGAFVGERKSFDRPVLVSFDGAGVSRTVGFLTRDALDALGLPGHVAVYVPQAYAFAGHVVVVDRSRVTPIALDSTQVMAFLVSGGVSGLAR